MFLAYIDPGTGFTITSVGGIIAVFVSGVFGFVLVFLKKIVRFIKKHGRFFLALLIIAIIALAGTLFAMHQKPSAYDGKVIVLGFDALSPRVLEPLMARGELPHFARLKEEGAYRHLQTTNPPQSPVAWVGFATGQNPGKTGIFDFIARDPKTYKIDLCLSNIKNNRALPVVKTRRFWQYATDKNVASFIVACPVTFPPDKIYGRMLSGMGVPDVLGTEGTFAFYTTEAKTEEETTGGKVVHLRRSPVMVSHLWGPKTAGLKGGARHVRVPLKVAMEPPDGRDGITIEYQRKKVRLRSGEWSGWQTVTFDLGFFRKMRGIFKFYLVESSPELKLYVTPINLDPRAPFFPISYPRDYSKDLSKQIGLYRTQGMPFDTWALNEKRIDEKVFMDNVREVLKEKKDMLDLEFQRLRDGILYVYFESPDIVQHMFWRYTDPRHPLYEADAPAQYKNMITNWYKEMDAVLGTVLGRLGPKDTLIVLSDHGFDTFRRAAHLNTWLRDNGYLELKDEGAMHGEPLLRGIDWSRTKAYAIGFNSLYINQAGREAEGIVAPGEETEKLKQEIASKLVQWTDPKYQQPVIHRVYKGEEAFWGPYRDKAPDLLVGYNVGYRASWQTALGDVPRDQLEDNLKKWSGSHLFDPELVPGILFTNRPVSKENPSILDIAPTILKTIGYTEEELKTLDLDGKSLW